MSVPSTGNSLDTHAQGVFWELIGGLLGGTHQDPRRKQVLCVNCVVCTNNLGLGTTYQVDGGILPKPKPCHRPPKVCNQACSLTLFQEAPTSLDGEPWG